MTGEWPTFVALGGDVKWRDFQEADICHVLAEIARATQKLAHPLPRQLNGYHANHTSRHRSTRNTSLATAICPSQYFGESIGHNSCELL